MPCQVSKSCVSIPNAPPVLGAWARLMTLIGRVGPTSVAAHLLPRGRGCGEPSDSVLEGRDGIPALFAQYVLPYLPNLSINPPEMPSALPLKGEISAAFLCSTMQVAGYGATCDAHHITAPAPDGAGLARAIDASLKMGNITPEVGTWHSRNIRTSRVARGVCASTQT